jgi:hypothetical protein
MRRLGTIFIMGAVVVGLIAPLKAFGDSTRPLFEQVGTLERFPADARALLGDKLVPLNGNTDNDIQKQASGTAIVVPRSRLLVQLYPPATGTTQTGVVVRDLDTLRIVGTLRLGVSFDRASVAAAGDWTHAVDDTGRRLWLLQRDELVVHEVDLHTLKVATRPLPRQTVPTGLGFPFGVGGMTYDPREDDLLLLYGGPASFSAGNTNTLLYRLDVSTTTPAAFDPTRLYRLRACTGPLSSADSAAADTSNWDILVTEDYLYVPCQRAGHTVVVVRTRRPGGDDPATHTEDVAAGPVWGTSVLADQAGGRLFVTTLVGREVWVFEAATMSFVGAVATGPNNTQLRTGYGLDTETGRVFFQSSTFGLGVVEGRFFPVPQARTMPRSAVGQERIWSDARTGRVFVLEGTEAAKAAAWRVYRTGPAPLPPPAPDPDRNTADTAEKEGVTEARFDATGSGYGARVLLAKGLATVPPAPSLGGVNPLAEQMVNSTNPTLKKCGFTDRDLFLGRVAKAEYDTGSTAARAVAAVVDSATEQDLNRPSRCDVSGRDSPEGSPRWDYRPAACASSEGMEKEQETDEGEDHGSLVGTFGPSTVTCPRPPGGALQARAETKLTGLAAVEVAQSQTTVTVERPKTGGVRSTVESAARGITVDLGEGIGVLRIGEIRSTAVSTSDGRPKRPNLSTHRITIADVRVGEQALCEKVCTDPVELEDALNLLAGGRAVFHTGTGDNSGRDDALLAGSPRGAQTAVQKSVARQASDRALVGDFTTEIPAFEVTMFNDNVYWGRARQIYQFAGVATSATYNVVVLPTGSAFIDADDQDTTAGFPGNDSQADQTFTEEPLVSLAEAVTGKQPFSLSRLITRAAQAVGKGLRLFLTNPRQFLLLLTAWGLFALPPILSRRRRLLNAARMP